MLAPLEMLDPQRIQFLGITDPEIAHQDNDVRQRLFSDGEQLLFGRFV